MALRCILVHNIRPTCKMHKNNSAFMIWLCYFNDYSYRWEKNGQRLEITGVDIKQEPGAGTIVFVSPKDEHEGSYQCLATNEFGTALSSKTMLKAASE